MKIKTATLLEYNKEGWLNDYWIGKHTLKKKVRGFPGGAVVENLPANAGDTGSSPGLGRSHMPRRNMVIFEGFI